MLAKSDGDPAFPAMAFTEKQYRGMSIRDYFAAAAMQGIIACFKDHEGADTVETRVEKAYEYADAMLEERNK